MRYYLLKMLFITITFDGFSQNELTEYFLGRIYINETQVSFFQLEESGNATYYTIEEFSERELNKHSATWTILEDTTLVLNIKYGIDLDSVNFLLKYFPDKDYWLGIEMPTAYRRMKYITYREFYIEEF